MIMFSLNREFVKKTSRMAIQLCTLYDVCIVIDDEDLPLDGRMTIFHTLCYAPTQHV